jgi:filamentous hemagglutinin family protein
VISPYISSGRKLIGKLMIKAIAELTSNSASIQRPRKQTKAIFQGLCIFVACSLANIPAKATAQVIPDGTLPASVEQLREIMRINGGERAGNNLFHSFEEFSIPEGMEAVFENATDIENIFTRITGESVSNIEGILRTQGGANFFLVNPNGIIFGENASLDVGGSFIATTADNIQFEGGTEFATNDSAQKPIITIDRPIGLNFGGNSGAIQVNGNGNQITPSFSSLPTQVEDNANGLRVKPKNTIALVGGDIVLNGGTVNANDGRIELASVNSGTTNFQSTENGLTFDFNNVTNYRNIDITNLSVLNASGENQGEISLAARSVDVLNGSLFLVQNQGDIPSGTISINATESLTLSGTSNDGNVSSAIRSETLNSGDGADIDISTEKIVLEDGARIGASTYGDAQGGNLAIDSKDSIQLLDNSSVNPKRQTFLTSSIANSTYGSGDAGSLQLSTSQLKVTDGGAVVSSTIGSGNGGNITINARTIEVAGLKPERNTFSSISASSVNSGYGGTVTVKTSELKVLDGATFSSSSFATGNAGSLIIDASELIEISGESNNVPSRIRASVDSVDSSAAQIRLGLSNVLSGNSGNININTPALNVNQRGEISVENQGVGNGGTLFINADKLNLEESGSITAATFSGQGGNITLNTKNLQLDEDSSITATAENDGDGGNVTINTTALLAKKNSEIIANAFAGTGGNIQIDTKGLFLFPDSTIEASSELGIDGTVRINTLDTNLQKDLEASELNLITDEDTLANSCLARRNEQQGTFVINNGSSLSTMGESEFYDSGSITGIDNSFSNLEVEQLPIIEPQSSDSPIPAQQAVKTNDGRVFLVSAPQSVKSLICN